MWSRGSHVPGADAVAVGAGRVLEVGRSADLIARRSPATRVLDAGGATVTPGLCDAHLHLVHWARARADLDLHGAASRAEAVDRVQRFLEAHPGTAPLTGRGWDANGWQDRPEREPLDRIAESRPVLLYSRDLHNLWVNGAALRAARIDRATADPPGGTIERDVTGEPTGLLMEHAMRLAAELERLPGDLDFQRTREAVRALHAHGITSVHDFEGADAHHILRRLSAGRGPRIRTLMHLPHAQLDAAIEIGLESGLGDAWFRLGGVKLFADGTLGSRTAALLAPYDGTNESGLDLLEPAALREIVERAARHGLATAIHAIGDRAVRSALDAFEAAHAFLGDLAVPPRVEHVQLLDPADRPRFAALGVAASMQPSHCVSDIPLAERYWGSRRAHSYPWRALLESGALVAFGSDAPVEPPSAALGIHAALVRRPVGATRPPYVAEQAIGIDAALTAYTEAPARLAGNWPGVGALDPGCAADLVVWSDDLHALAPDAVAAASPVATVLGGEIVFEAEHAVGRGPVAAAARPIEVHP